MIMVSAKGYKGKLKSIEAIPVTIDFCGNDIFAYDVEIEIEIDVTVSLDSLMESEIFIYEVKNNEC